MTYVAAEPGMTEAYTDVQGEMHATREDAIDANFAYDLRKAINAEIEADELLHEAPVRSVHDLVRNFVTNNPDMVRVMLGDRDAT